MSPIYALTANNNTIAWGDNLSGQFGIGTKSSKYTTPQTIGDKYTSLQYMIYPSPSLSHTLYLISGLSCFALQAFDELVCSGRGVCSSFDNCSCDSGFTGKDCSLPICYDLHAGEPEVCSGHGQCLTIDKCLCRLGYTGEKCENKDAGIVYGSGDNSYGQLANTLRRYLHAPTSRDDSFDSHRNIPIDIDVLANDSDVDGDELAIVVSGTITTAQGGQVTRISNKLLR